MFTKILNRIFDITLAIFLLILFLPVIIIISILIKIYDKGSIFADNSYRIGKEGKRFWMFKFRSMIPSAHVIIQSDRKYSKLKKKWLVDKLTINEDPRITVIGKIIRRLDVDEIAQILNVLKGEMSIVGPRPFFPEELENITQKNKMLKKMSKLILSVKPGITGLWQVSGRNRNTITQRFKIDCNYVKRKSIFLDLYIIIKTPFVILEHIIKGE